MAKQSYDHLIKIMTIGDSGVGKSSIINTYFGEPFQEGHLATIGVDFKIKTLHINDKKIKLQIWDTAGQERFHSICSSYYRGAMGIILTYDITNGKSFDNISKWLRNVDEDANPDVLKVIVGNKCDLESLRVVPTCIGEELSKKTNIPFYEVSAKDDINIKNVIDGMATNIVNKISKPLEEVKTTTPETNPFNIKFNMTFLKTQSKQLNCCSS